MIEAADAPRSLSRLVVSQCGSLEATGDPFEPYRLVDAAGVVVAPMVAYFRELAACGRSAATQRSYGMDLLRWFRFLWAVGVGWDQATRSEARDFCQWIRVAAKPARPGGRSGAGGSVSAGGTAPGAPRACPVDHGVGFRSQIRMVATSTVPR